MSEGDVQDIPEWLMGSETRGPRDHLCHLLCLYLKVNDLDKMGLICSMNTAKVYWRSNFSGSSFEVRCTCDIDRHYLISVYWSINFFSTFLKSACQSTNGHSKIWLGQWTTFCSYGLVEHCNNKVRVGVVSEYAKLSHNYGIICQNNSHLWD